MGHSLFAFSFAFSQCLLFILGLCGLTHSCSNFFGVQLHCSYGYHTDKNQFLLHSTNIYYHEPRTVLLSLLTISKTPKMKKTQTNPRISIESPPFIKASRASGLLNESAQQTQQDGRWLATPFWCWNQYKFNSSSLSIFPRWTVLCWQLKDYAEAKLFPKEFII